MQREYQNKIDELPKGAVVKKKLAITNTTI